MIKLCLKIIWLMIMCNLTVYLSVHGSSTISIYMHAPNLILTSDNTNYRRMESRKYRICPLALTAFSPLAATWESRFSGGQQSANLNVVTYSFLGSKSSPSKVVAHPCVLAMSRVDIYQHGPSDKSMFRLAHLSSAIPEQMQLGSKPIANKLYIYDYALSSYNNPALHSAFTETISNDWGGISLYCTGQQTCGPYGEAISKRAQALLPPFTYTMGATVQRSSFTPLVYFYISVTRQGTSNRLNLVKRDFSILTTVIAERSRQVIDSIGMATDYIFNSTAVTNRWTEQNLPSLSIASSQNIANEGARAFSAVLYSLAHYRDITEILSNTIYNTGLYWTVYDQSTKNVSAPIVIDNYGIMGNVIFTGPDTTAVVYLRLTNQTSTVEVVYTFGAVLTAERDLNSSKVVLAKFSVENFRLLQAPRIESLSESIQTSYSEQIVISIMIDDELKHIVCKNITCAEYTTYKAHIPTFPNTIDETFRVEVTNMQRYKYNVWNNNTHNIPMIATSISHPLLGMSTFVMPLRDSKYWWTEYGEYCQIKSGDMCLVMTNSFDFSETCTKMPTAPSDYIHHSKVDYRILVVVVAAGVTLLVITIAGVAILCIFKYFSQKREDKDILSIDTLQRSQATELESPKVSAKPSKFHCVPSAPKFQLPPQDRTMTFESTND